MLTEEQKALLDRAFRKHSSHELTLQQAHKIATQTNLPLRAVEWFALQKAIVPCRYQRHIGSLGIAGQKKLLESKAVLVGLGGLGGYVLEELARAGLGRIVGIDPDEFEETNLNRQLLARQDNLGRKKVDEAGDRLRKVNKAVQFLGYATSLEQLADEIWRDADLVFDCLDNIKDRLTLAKKCSTANVPLVHGAIAGWYGQVAVVWPGTAMLERIYKDQRKGIEQSLGNPPFTAATAASIMVAEAIKILTGKTAGKENEMLFFDLLENEWQTLTF